jgi:uncharacterized protein (DUF1330 family)
MSPNYKLALALTAGVVIGASGSAVLYAQQSKAPPAYYIANIDVTDAAAYQQYAAKVPPTMAPFNGRFLARGGKVQVFEGDAPKRFVIVAFNSMEDANKWRSSEALAKLRPERDKSAKLIQSFAVEGVAESLAPAVGSSTPPTTK